jgi:hypothetical protein
MVKVKGAMKGWTAALASTAAAAVVSGCGGRIIVESDRAGYGGILNAGETSALGGSGADVDTAHVGDTSALGGSGTGVVTQCLVAQLRLKTSLDSRLRICVKRKSACFLLRQCYGLAGSLRDWLGAAVLAPHVPVGRQGQTNSLFASSSVGAQRQVSEPASPWESLVFLQALIGARSLFHRPRNPGHPGRVLGRPRERCLRPGVRFAHPLDRVRGVHRVLAHHGAGALGYRHRRQPHRRLPFLRFSDGDDRPRAVKGPTRPT